MAFVCFVKRNGATLPTKAPGGSGERGERGERVRRVRRVRGKQPAVLVALSGEVDTYQANNPQNKIRSRRDGFHPDNP